MARIVAIDPGKCSGWALGDEHLCASGMFDPDGFYQSPRDVVENLGWLGSVRHVRDGTCALERAYEYGRSEQITATAVPRCLLGGCDLLVAEMPQLTRIGPGTLVDRADNLMILALRLGRIVQQIPHRRLIRWLPAQWKRQVPKGIHNRRVQAKLTPAERQVASTNHNAIDAIGLYLHARKNI